MFRLEFLSRLGCHFLCDGIKKTTKKFYILTGVLIHSKKTYMVHVKMFKDGRCSRICKISGNSQQQKETLSNLYSLFLYGMKFNVNGVRMLFVEYCLAALIKTLIIFFSLLLALKCVWYMFCRAVFPYIMYFFICMTCFFLTILYHGKERIPDEKTK